MSKTNILEYSKLIQKASPDFIHVKGFKSLGYSRNRMGYDKQPFHSEIKIFAEKLMNELNKHTKFKEPWKICGEEERSCVVLLAKDKNKLKIKRI